MYQPWLSGMTPKEGGREVVIDSKEEGLKVKSVRLSESQSPPQGYLCIQQMELYTAGSMPFMMRGCS